MFVLLAGFSAVLAYWRVFEGQGFKAGVGRVFDRVRDIYLWHLALIVICGIGLTFAATYFGNFSLRPEHRRARVLARIRRARPCWRRCSSTSRTSLNILPLYIVLMMFWVPFVLWLIRAIRGRRSCLSVGLWAAANLLSANLPSHHPSARAGCSIRSLGSS